MGTLRKPLLLLTAVIVAVVCAALGGLLFWIQSQAGLAWLQSRINAAIPGSITIERHRISLLRPRLDLQGVTLQDARGAPLAGFTRFSAELEWRPLLHREIHLSLVHLDQPWADLIVDPATGVNLITAIVPPDGSQKKPETPTDGTGLPFNVVCRSIELIDGRLSLVHAGQRVEADELTLSAEGDLMARQGSLELTLASLRFSSPGIHPQPARIAVKARLDGDTLSLSGIDLLSGQTTATLNGSIASLTTRPTVDGSLAISSQLEELKTVFDLAGDYAGAADARLTLTGALADPDARLELILDRSRLAGRPLDHARLSIQLKDRQAIIGDTEVQLAGGTCRLNGTVDLRSAFPTGFIDPPTDLDAIAYALDLTADIPNLNPWLESLVDLRGRLRGRIDLAGRGLSPSGMSTQLKLDASAFDLLAPGLDRAVKADLQLSAQVDQGSYTVDGLRAVADGVSLSGRGRFQSQDRTLAGDISLAAPDLSRALAVVGIPWAKGACDGSLTVTGSLERPQFALTLSARELDLRAYTLGDLTLAADMDHDGRLNLRTLNMKNRRSRIRGNGRLRLLPGGGGIDPGFANAVDIRLESLSAADFMASPPVTGTLDGRLRINGPLKALQSTLELKGTALSSAVAFIGDVDARLRMNDGIVLVERFDLHNHSSALTAEGRIQVLIPGTLRPVEDPSFAFTAAADHLDPADFIDAVTGDLAFDTALTGSLANPSGRLTLSGSRIAVAGQSIDSLSLDSRLDGRQLWLDRLVASLAPGNTIEVAGRLGLDQTLALRVKSDGIAVGNIQSLHDVFPGTGIVQVDATASGSIGNPDIDGRLTVSDITINAEPIEDMHLAFSLHDMQAKAVGNLNFDLDAFCDLRQGGFDLKAILDRTETAAYFKAAGMPDLHGTLSGRVEATGNIRDALNATAQVDITALHLLTKQTSLVKTERIRMQLANQALSIPECELAVLSTGHLRLKGDVRLGGSLDMAINGRIPVAAAAVFSDELAGATGSVVLDGRVTGDTVAPVYDARIDLENIAMAIPGLVQKLHDLNGRIALTAETVRIEALKGFLDTGSFNLAGVIGLDAFTPNTVNLTLQTRALPLEVPDTLSLLLNSDIIVSGGNRSAEAKGEIVVLEGLYYKDVRINLLQLATTRQRAVSPAPRPLSVPFFDRVDLDIAIHHRQPFSVENNLAQLTISPDLKVGGTLANPILSGRAQVREGTVTFQKKTFDVQKGVIDFVNPYKTVAEVDIVSQAVIRTWTVTLAIKGTLDNLDLKLSSVPSETGSDILSLILFGRTGQELSAGEGATKRTTGQIMAELIADTFGDDIKKQTGVDILQVEDNSGGENGTVGGVKVTVGKHLSDRMTVKYAVESKDGEIVQRAIAEYKLLENILVSGFQDTTGIYGSELVFRIEFR